MDHAGSARARQGAERNPPELILAAADYADGIRTVPPPELAKAWGCKRWNTLPRAGGLDDQLVRVMLHMDAAQAVYTAMLTYDTADKAGLINDEWMKRNAHIVRVWSNVQILRAKHARL